MSVTDDWLQAIDKAGRDLIDAPAAIDSLDALEAAHTRPTIGWMQRHTRKREAAA